MSVKFSGVGKLTFGHMLDRWERDPVAEGSGSCYLERDDFIEGIIASWLRILELSLRDVIEAPSLLSLIVSIFFRDFTEAKLCLRTFVFCSDYYCWLITLLRIDVLDWMAATVLESEAI